jgi:ankyrin repeat protein
VGKNDVTAFCEAVWRRDATTLAALGPRVDPNALDRWKRTPLLMAAEFGDLALMALLVGRGGDVDQNRRHLTPVTMAARRGDLAMVRFLRDRGATMSAVTWIYLHDQKQVELALSGDPALAHLRDERGTPILHHATEALAPDLVVLLLEQGASVRDQDENRETGSAFARRRVVEALSKQGLTTQEIYPALAPAGPAAPPSTFIVVVDASILFPSRSGTPCSALRSS